MNQTVIPTSLDTSAHVSTDAFVFASSFAQRRLWFLSQLQPDAATYHIVSGFRLRGALNIAALEASVNAIVKRQELLRTAFEMQDDALVQLIYPELAVRMTIVDLTGLPVKSREPEAQGAASEFANQSFDLGNAPLFRMTVLRLDEQEHILLVVIHHIIADGWSMDVFYKELGALYTSTIEGVPASLRELPVQYADFTEWQNEWLRGETLASQLAYWKQQLEGALALDLPTDFSRRADMKNKGGRVELPLAQDLVRALEELSRSEQVTLFMTLLAAFQLVLARWSGQTDILVGTPIAGRMRREIEGLIGLFLNMLVLRTSLAGDPTVREMLARTRQTALEAYSNQDIPFEKLLEELKPVRDLNRTPFFQVLFNMPLLEKNALVLPGVQVAAWQQLQSDSKFEMTLYVEQIGGTRQLVLVYDASLFSAERMREFLDQYVHVLSQLADKPDARISQFSLVTKNAARVLPDPSIPLANEWRGAVHARLAENARDAPNRIAIRDANESWTNQELDRRTNQLANALIQAGIQRGDTVAVYAHRSAALVLAILGTHRAGAASLILDPAYPTARLRACLASAKPRGWIQIERAGALAVDLEQEVSNGNYLCRISLPPTIRMGTSPISTVSTESPGIEVGPDDIACVTFTSGSAGLPKGVLGRHGPLSHLLPWQQEAFGLDASDRFSVMSGLAHDPLQRDLFTPLWLGATICIPDPMTLETPGALAEWMVHEQITFANLTPAMLQVLALTTQEVQLPALRYAFFIGEKLTTHDVARLEGIAPRVRCINLYGSTETQRALGYYVVPNTRQDPPRKFVYPVGKGMPDTQLLVLGAGLQRAGVGESGEIYIRSLNLAQGYLDDEELTRARFLQNPWASSPKDRLYRTGDLGRYLPDGTVEILGRADRQINLRGFRIEPSEIEAALLAHPEIQEAVITANTNGEPGIRVAAYLVAKGNGEPAPQALRSHLRARLPEYMIPGDIIYLRALPITPNGKIDLNALPKPRRHQKLNHFESSEILTETERRLAPIWERVLQVHPIGAEDNFFELGGHSLLALQLFAQIEKEWGRKLPIAILFRAPTIRELAHVIVEKSEQAAASTLVPIRREGPRAPFFCVHGLGGGVMGYADLARLLGPDQPFYGLQAHGLDGRDEPDRQIESMAARYLGEIRRVQPQGPYYIGGYCYGGIVAFEMARQLEQLGQPVALVAIFEGYAMRHSEARKELWRPRGMARFVQNLPRWLVDYGPQKFDKTMARFGRSKRASGDQLVERVRDARLYDAEELVTSVELPAEHRRVIIAHVNALKEYQPQRFHGRVTLFRVRALSLTRCYDPKMGWGKLSEGVEIKMIPGTHYNILQRPHVEFLARELGTLLV